MKPDGLNINEGCGSTHPQLLQETVVASGAHIGIALDGDADRLIVVDENGRIIDGDQMMALVALDLQRRGELRGGSVVATVMSNLGLERRLRKRASASSAPRSATGTCWRRCARKGATSAASSRGTSSSAIIRPPATGSSRRSRCSRRWSIPSKRRARCSISSTPCRSC